MREPHQFWPPPNNVDADLKARADALIEEYRGDKVADVVAALGWEVARLTRERDEAQAKERERCAKIAETFDEGDRQTAAFVHAQNIAAAIRGG